VTTLSRHTRGALISCFLVSCGGSQGGGSPSTQSLDACAILTQADASALFDQAARASEEVEVTDPGYLGGCSWSWESSDESSRQILVLDVWQGEEYYSPSPKAEPFDIGDEGSVAASTGTGVDVSWKQQGKTASLGYFAIGPDAPDPVTKREEVESLALGVADEL
jgi:hypothetical protein